MINSCLDIWPLFQIATCIFIHEVYFYKWMYDIGIQFESGRFKDGQLNNIAP